jgi:hypothetical protein
MFYYRIPGIIDKNYQWLGKNEAVIDHNNILGVLICVIFVRKFNKCRLQC